MFRVGEKVVYPNHGVSVVERIALSAPDGGQKQTYFHLRLLANDSKVMVPEENLDRVGLRRLAREREIKDLLALIEDGNIDVYKDWKGRYKQNLDKMRTGDLTARTRRHMLCGRCTTRRARSRSTSTSAWTARGAHADPPAIQRRPEA